MRRPLLSLFSRLTAGALLFQATAPGALAIKDTVDVGLARRQTKAALRAAALRPPKPMKGVPTMRVTPAVPAPPLTNAPVSAASQPGSYLNEVGRRPGGIDPALVATWKSELKRPGVPVARQAWLQLWIGEAKLAAEEPDDAEGSLARALQLGKASPVEGIAAYDLAAARFYEGRYAEGAHELRALMKSRKRGYSRRDASAFMRHMALCDGYHARHESLGVPEPPRLDPLCGVASVAVCLRALGIPFDKPALEKVVPHHGMGSTLAELDQASRKLGLSPHVLAVNKDAGLIALPKPLVAHVEHDHFVAVVEADTKGVEYICSDCGPWPGGPVRLTWKQWNSLETDAYMAVSASGSAADLALEALEHGTKARDLGLVASTHPSGSSQTVEAARRLLNALGTTVVLNGGGYPAGNLTFSCGLHPDSDKCIPCAINAFFESLGLPGPFAVTAGDPVNLSTGEEEYAPPADLTVYNPKGPSVTWGHMYGSLSRYSSGFGEGWTHPYSRGVELTSSSSGTLAGGVMFADGARMTFSGTKPTVGAPHQTMALGAGMPYLLSADYDAATTGCTFTLTDESRTQWTTLAVGYPNDCIRNSTVYPIAKETDRSGNWISFVYNTYHPAVVSGVTSPTVLRLSEIDDSAGSPLLSIGMDSNGWITSVSDRYSRSVYYATSEHNATPPYTPPPYWYQIPHRLLDSVSQIVTTGTVSPAVRYAYGYAPGPTGESNEDVPYLSSISVPSPTGSGMSTATFTYDPDLGHITRITDSNGHTTWFTPPQPPQPQPAPNPPIPGIPWTAVETHDGSTIVRKYGVVSDSNMNPTQLVDAGGNTVWTKTYSDPNDPYRPSAVTDGNGRTWHYTWDSHGHLLTSTSPKGTVTTCTYDYSHFALGELTSVQEGSKTATSVAYYEPSGLPQTVTTPIPGDVGTGSTQATSYTYTAMGQLSSVTEPGSGAGLSRTTSYNYTTDGTYSQAEALGEPLTVTDGTGKVWHREYDVRGNLVVTKDPSGIESDVFPNLADQTVTEVLPATGNSGSGNASVVTTYLYPGGPPTEVDAKDESGTVVRTTNLTYGPEGETLSRTGSAEEAHLTYDAAYSVQTVRGGSGGSTTYSYDLNGRPTEIDYPLASGTTNDRVLFTSYDAVGNLLSRTDGNGQVTNYTYGDTDGGLSSVVYPGASGSNVSLSYDGYDRTTSVTDGTGVETTAYDDLDETTSTTTTYTGLPAQTLAYTFFPDGSRHTMTNPAGTWTYAYDGVGRYTSMSSPVGTSYAAYLDNGWQSQRTLPNGRVTNYGHNAVGALNTLDNYGVSVYNSFTYDGVFNTTGVTSYVPVVSSHSGTTTYAYDAKDRLTGESSTRVGGYAQTHAYDGAGNPTTFRGAAGTFDADNRATGSAFAYDGNGSPTTYRGAGMAYDPEARATTIGTLTAGYRADGLRAWKQPSGNPKTYFLYDGSEPVCELDVYGNVSATNVFAPDGLVARGTPSGGWIQYLFDPEGNVAQRLANANYVVSASCYDGYGQESSVGTPGDPFGYHAQQGYYLDRETGLYYCQNRYYDPGTGRWVTRDPIGYDGGINLYGYCESGPMGASDSEGLQGLAAGGTVVTGPVTEGMIAPGIMNYLMGAGTGAGGLGALGMGAAMFAAGGCGYGLGWLIGKIPAVDRSQKFYGNMLGGDFGYLPAPSAAGGPRLHRSRERGYYIDPLENIAGHTRDECVAIWERMYDRIVRSRTLTPLQKKWLIDELDDWKTNCFRNSRG